MIGTEYCQSPGQAGITLIDTGIAARPGLDKHLRIDVFCT